MYNFILKHRPLSYNSNTRGTKKEAYKAALEASFRSYCPTGTILSGESYGIVYHFFNKDIFLDTDNLSKPVWDNLKGVLFGDDKQIKIRIAGSFNLTKGDFQLLDLSGLDGQLVGDLLDAIGSEDHIIYVECGKINPSMYKFNME